MSKPTPAEFKGRFPEFSTVSDAVVQSLIDESDAVLNESTWGDCYKSAVMFRAGHFLVGNQIAAGGNPEGLRLANSKSVDSASIGYTDLSSGSKSPLESDMMSTYYGRLYLNLRRSCIGSYMNVAC